MNFGVNKEKMDMMPFRTYGQKPYTIAVIHGGPGAGGEMAPVARQLSSEWGVIEPIQTKKSIEKQIQELKSTITKNCSSSLILVGYSWGAWLSLLFAVQHKSDVKKIILISSGPFEEKYVDQLRTTRTNRLSKEERAEFETIITKLNTENLYQNDAEFKRLGELGSKTDNFNPMKKEVEDEIQVKDSSEIYQLVWGEAAKLRKNGQLLELTKSITCPVTAIQGDYDPHPYEGVEVPLSRTLRNFKFHLIKKCGHTPWLENEAYKEFYQILNDEIENV
ncbi:alpha/beta hydrolase [Candidatus Heimdallarchaeota archaeon B3_Heim]|nr:MAG: alpha/beta hydrolase [Candidatus Heimdallarchaeota archaeon B3_Heim]